MCADHRGKEGGGGAQSIFVGVVSFEFPVNTACTLSSAIVIYMFIVEVNSKLYHAWQINAM